MHMSPVVCSIQTANYSGIHRKGLYAETNFGGEMALLLAFNKLVAMWLSTELSIGKNFRYASHGKLLRSHLPICCLPNAAGGDVDINDSRQTRSFTKCA